jgi:aryl-alcohol dehydrogenase-like predicted oxidoreductase
MSFSPLVLGTAQFGLKYGIANKKGKLDQHQVVQIVHEAWNNGIHEFDTAQAYGDSEVLLGDALTELGISEEAKITTKFNPNLDHLDVDIMSQALEKSVETIGVPKLFAVMVHSENMLTIWTEGLAEILLSFVSSGRVEKIGFSVYSPDKALDALNLQGVDIVQLPTNIFDRRFERAGVFALAHKLRKQVYTRSVFLQGLILMNIEEVPDELQAAKAQLRKLEAISRHYGLTRKQIALGYLKLEAPNSKIVFGAETKEQVLENVEALRKEIPPSLLDEIRTEFAHVSEKVLNPSLWKEVGSFRQFEG